MRGVNLTRFGHASVDFIEKEDRIPALKARSMALNIGRATGRAAAITPAPLGELVA